MPHHPDVVERDRFVLLVIDVQERLAAAMERRAEVVAATVRLIEVTAILGAPILVTRQYPAGLGETDPDVAAALVRASATVPVATIDKMAFSAAGEADFAVALEGTNRDLVVVAGMETHICVTQTALALASAGYRVHVVEDACCSRRSRDHTIALARLREQRITVTCTESVIYEAAGRAGTDEFRRLLAVVKQG